MISRVFDPRTRPGFDELELSRTLTKAASALDADEPAVCLARGPRIVPTRQRLLAVAALTEHEDGLSALQRLAVIDAASWWLSEENGYALLGATCLTETATQHAYLALIGAPSDSPDDHSEDLPS